jgi:pimeloyl-ACP methyl ester carboxylesterase
VLLLFAPPSTRHGRAFQRYDAARLFPNARGVTIEDTGHHIQHQQTARTIEEMRKFFDDTKDYRPAPSPMD